MTVPLLDPRLAPRRGCAGNFSDGSRPFSNGSIHGSNGEQLAFDRRIRHRRDLQLPRPVRVITDYRAPKNHIFFNLLNSVLPARESLNPARVRLLSILATGAIPVLMILVAMALRRFLEAGVFLALWAFSPEMLEHSMEARGYGFLALFALIAAIGTLAYLQTDHRFWLGVAAASVVLGIYTVPSFVFFGGPLLLFIWVTTRRREVFVIGAIAVALTLLLYLPVLTQLIAASSNFNDDGKNNDFGTGYGLLRVIKLYLFSASNLATLAFAAAIALTPFALLFTNCHRGTARGLATVSAASLAAFGILFFLQSPPVRIAAFITVPFAFAGIFAGGAVLRDFAPFPLRAIVVAALGVSLISTSVPALRAVNFVPTEDWIRAANWIDAALPPDAKVDFKERAKYLKQTLVDFESRSASFDETAFRSGNLVVASAPFKWAEEERFTRPADEPRVATVTVPGRNREISLTFRLPEDHRIADLPPELSDGSVATGLPPTDLTLTAADGQALVILLDRTVRQRFAVAHVRDAKTGENLAEDPGVVHAGNSIAIPIPDGLNLEVDITLYDPEAKIVETWVTPSQ